MSNKISIQEKTKLWTKFLILSKKTVLLNQKLQKIQSDIADMFFNENMTQEEYADRVKSFDVDNASDLLATLMIADKQFAEVSEQLGFNETNPIVN